MRIALAWMLLCSAALAQRPEPGVPPGWTVYVVHAPWCAPCQRFRRDYDTIAQFRGPLESAFSVKSCEWERPSEQRFARRFGVAQLPGFIVFRNGIHQQSFTGYDGNWRAFLERLNLDNSGVDGAESSKAKSGTPQELIRPITPEERAIPEIADLRAELDRLRREMAEVAKQRSDTVPGVLPDTKPAELPGRQAESPPLPPVLSIPANEAPAGGGSGVADQWGKVGLAALTLLAPQFAIPAGAIGVAGTVFQMLRKRRQAMQAQQPQRQTVVERPVIVATDTPPAPARVEQTTHYVPVEKDTHQEAWKWAADQYVRKNPGSEGTIGALNHLIGQFVSGKRAV